MVKEKYESDKQCYSLHFYYSTTCLLLYRTFNVNLWLFIKVKIPNAILLAHKSNLFELTGQINLYQELPLCQYFKNNQQDDKQRSASKNSDEGTGTDNCHVIFQVPDTVSYILSENSGCSTSTMCINVFLHIHILLFPFKCSYMQIQNSHNYLHINNLMETKLKGTVLITEKRLTCAWGGFHRMFLRGAGVKPDVPAGLFFSSSTTPLGSSLSLATRFFSCQPTYSRKHPKSYSHFQEPGRFRVNNC